MSCLGNNYSPNPTREWTRFHNRCTDESFTPADAFRIQMYRKGNILQYKKNAANFTKNQQYGRIAQKSYTSWGSQTENNSNPNVGLLKRSGETYIIAPQSSNIIDNSTITSVQNINCLASNRAKVIAVLPTTASSGLPPPPPPPPPPPQTGTGGGPPIIEPPGTVLYVIPNGGTLQCNQIVAPCTGQLLQEFRAGECYPSTCSDVPGRPVLLCWSGREPTYYPRVKRTYGTSTNKWPFNAKFIRAAT